VIDIKHDHTDRDGFALRLAKFPFQSLFQVAAVVQAGQWVADGLLA